MVPARLTVVTLGARDLPSLREFYTRLGWPLAIEMDGFAVFGLHGAVLALFPLDELAADGHVEAAAPAEGIAASLAINVDERDEVDAALDAARAAGGRVTKEPVDADWGGRTAYFADPEDNYWEIAWVPPDSSMAAAIARATASA
jgi:catechol 2,3-dioxygenase-like lactoylglutathione lyase family enzyme